MLYTPTIIARLCDDLYLDPYDKNYLISRLKNEGVKFLTVTLPKLSKVVLQSLELGYFLQSELTEFRWKGRLLKNFSRLLLDIFHTDGTVLLDPNPVALARLRQLSEYAYKLSIEAESTLQNEKSFLEEDKELTDYDTSFVDQLRKDFSTYYREIHDAVPDKILHAHHPHFGPGTFSGKSDYELNEGHPWYLRKYMVEPPHPEFRNYFWALTPNVGPRRKQTRPLSTEVSYSELLFVPKDSRGPRTIVREPASLLRFHMAYNSFLSKTLTRLSYGRVQFGDQSVNQKLAKEASITGEWATLDLKSASDRVNKNIIFHIFRYSPLQAFVRARSKVCKTQNFGYVKLNKLAGMGSGLTFPTMSLLIYLSIVRAIVDRCRIPYRLAQRQVYVYGDDIIVKTSCVGIAKDAMARVNLKVNSSKSYYRGHFRESCGGDYFLGNDVAPVRLKLSSSGVRSYCRNDRSVRNKTKLWLTYASTGKHSRQTKKNFFILGLERHARELIHKGFQGLADYYYEVIESLGYPLPYVTGEASCLGRYTLDSSLVKTPCDSTGTHLPVKVVVPVACTKRLPLEDSRVDNYRILESLMRRIRIGFFDENGFNPTYRPTDGPVDVAGVPRRIHLKRRKVCSLALLG